MSPKAVLEPFSFICGDFTSGNFTIYIIVSDCKWYTVEVKCGDFAHHSSGSDFAIPCFVTVEVK
jgi:hypothetical protein